MARPPQFPEWAQWAHFILTIFIFLEKAFIYLRRKYSYRLVTDEQGNIRVRQYQDNNNNGNATKMPLQPPIWAQCLHFILTIFIYLEKAFLYIGHYCPYRLVTDERGFVQVKKKKTNNNNNN
ncbi:hypothetical protein H110_01612 [Trichophyton rubrum MR1448]|nr:hypothetical protein H110_01612 [Trichophyton rubrum MR1448]